MWNDEYRRTYTVTLFIEHEGSDGPPGVGTVAGLTTNSNGGTAPAVLVLSTRNGTSRHWHGRANVEWKWR